MEKNIYITNFTTLRSDTSGRRYTETDEGLIVSGLLTKFDEVNFNNLKFTANSYDKCIADYFEANRLNVPLSIQHNDNDIAHLVGRVETMEKTDEGVLITAIVLKSHPSYTTVKALIDGGVLQGFSNFGYVAEGHFDDGGALVIERFNLLSASIVATPADVNGKFEAKNTRFHGFTSQKERKEDENEQKSDIYTIF